MTKENPWKGMGNSVERRVNNVQRKRIYWVTDIHGRYGISFRIPEFFDGIGNLPKLRGVLLQKRNIGENQGELNIVLTNKEEWELFLALCNDLIFTALDSDGDKASISAVENRLLRWQELLKKERITELSIERQMGLYTELKCLRDIIAPKIGLKNAITSWGGCDFDRQDFLLDDIAIEVKSHKTSKGEIVRISSKYQLDSIKKKLILIVYSLTYSESGETVLDIVESIKEQLVAEDSYVLELFESKLLECDFIPELIERPLQVFLIDSHKNYLVAEGFPRIESYMLSSFIQKVNYSIELTYCARYKIEDDSIFEIESQE